MDFTRTFPVHESPEFVEEFFDGSRDSGFFPLPGYPRRAKVGDRVYAIYRGQIVGRCRITGIVRGSGETGVGSEDDSIDARCEVHVECPGERAPIVILRRGHQGIRYRPVPEWPGE